MTSQFASADQIARAVVAAARLVGTDPLAIFEAEPDIFRARARSLAIEALKIVLPDADRTALARGCGCLASAAGLALAAKARAAKWWREDWLDEVVGAVLAPEVDPEPEARPPAALKGVYRSPAKPRRSTRVLPVLGEPPAGSSALDRRTQEGRGHA